MVKYIKWNARVHWMEWNENTPSSLIVSWAPPLLQELDAPSSGFFPEACTHISLKRLTIMLRTFSWISLAMSEKETAFYISLPCLSVRY